MNAESSSQAQNVDHQEIAKFEAVASRWWDLEGEFKPLHRIKAAFLIKPSSTWAAVAAFWRKAWRVKVPK